jgi:hypothetical protein
MPTTPWFQLAQFNIGRARSPLDDPRMAEFVGQIEGVNRLAESSPGFVWRLVGEDGKSSSYVRTYEDPALLVNMSVWESIDALRAFAYQGEHLRVMRRRHEWFDPLPAPWQVLWWVPAGHRPTAGEGRRRLEFLVAHGPSPVAFGFGAPEVPPPAPEEPPGVSTAVSLSGRRFVLEANAEGGDCRPGLAFHYEQVGGRVWARYEGGGVRFGSLAARITGEHALDARYQHATDAGVVRSGRCDTRVDRLVDGRLRLREEWRWLSGAEGSGASTLVEA